MFSGSRVGDRSGRSNPLLSLLDPAIRADPYPLFKHLRETGPVEVENGSVVIFGDYESCSKILRDREMGSDATRSPLLRNLPKLEFSLESIFFLDPPDHGRQRKLVSNLFTPRTISDAEPMIRAAVDEIFRGFEGSGEVDIVRELSNPLTQRISCDLFGIPLGDREMLGDLSSSAAGASEIPTIGAGVGVSRLYSSDDIASMTRASFSIYSYFADLAHRRRKDRGGDIISRLVEASQRAGTGRHELTSGLLTLFAASHESTVNLISNCILAILRNPEQLAILRENPDAIPSAVDEVLRYDPPAQILSRVPLVGKRIGGVDVDRDKAIILLLAAASRDPSVYPDPDRFDVLRKSKSMSLAFGAGVHFCVGVSLAKLTAEVALSAFVERLKDVEIVEDSLSYRPRVVVRGLERMVIRFRHR